MFNSILKLIILLEIFIKEANAEIEMHIVTSKTKVRNCSIKFRVVKPILFLLLKNSFWSIFQ